ncbi:MAG TPA: ABC transporter permease [Candidatus Babeliales bacterium]|nr:ABC transporter permease [Candidatus Babeliales bacterium]
MISLAPIWATVLRYARVYKQDWNLPLAGFYWPMLDILIWGFLGTWIENSQPDQFHNYKAAALLGILLWQLVSRNCNIMFMSFLEELWSNNVVNLFSLPLRITEWMIGITLFSSIMICLVSMFCIFFIYLLYDVSITYLISTFLIFAPPLFISGIWIAFTCLQIAIMFGKRGIELGFIVGWMLAPFSGAYYPLDMLPHWAQTISSFLPMSYVFSGMRGYVMHQQDPTSYLIIGYALSTLYAISAITLFIYCFNRSKKNGLSRLAD